jgi:hypothetical protein
MKKGGPENSRKILRPFTARFLAAGGVGRIGVVPGEAGDQASTNQGLRVLFERVGFVPRIDFVG